tara:strand:+ start:2841 stop:3431 length:591 start_codon:yes stop_codon:yes gene_type:complete
MEEFNSNILLLLDNVDKFKKQKDKTIKLVNNHIIEKQYIAYYLYRIWMNNRKIVKNANTKTEFTKVLNYLEVPIRYHNLDVVYPMANKMVNNERQLDMIILTILKHFNKVEKIFGSANSNKINTNKMNSLEDIKKAALKPKNKNYESFNEFIKYKSLELIIQDIVQLKMFVPNLSKSSNRINIWEIFNPLVKEYID